MIIQYNNQLNIYTLIWIVPKYHTEKNYMKNVVVYRSLKELCQANSENSIIENNSKTVFFIVNNQVQERRSNIKQKQQKKHSMDDYNENREFSCKNLNENEALGNSRNIEKQVDKENYFKIYNYDNENGCRSKNDDNNNINKNKKSCSASISHGDNISKEVVRHIAFVEGGELKRKDNVNSEATPTFVADDLVNNYTQNQCKINDEPGNERPKENDIILLEIQTTDSQPLTTFVATQGIAVATQQNVPQHLSHRHLVNDLEDKLLHGQQKNLNNLLDVAGNLCSGSIGALCDMAAFSKLDFSPLSDLKDQTTNNQEFLAKKYYHPLYAHGVCRWPGCELPLDDMATFVQLSTTGIKFEIICGRTPAE